MRFMGITDSDQRMNFLRSCAGTELTKLREKEVRVVFEATRVGEVAVPANTYEQVLESTKMTLLNLNQVWPGTSGKAKKRTVRHIMAEGGDLEGEGRGREVQGQDIVVGMNEAKGTDRQGKYEAEGTGHQGMYKAEGAGHLGMYKAEGAGRQDKYEAEGAEHQGMNKDEGTGRPGMYKVEGSGHRDKYEAEGAEHQGMNKGEDTGRQCMYKAQGTGRQDIYKAAGAGHQGM